MCGNGRSPTKTIVSTHPIRLSEGVGRLAAGELPRGSGAKPKPVSGQRNDLSSCRIYRLTHGIRFYAMQPWTQDGRFKILYRNGRRFAGATPLGRGGKRDEDCAIRLSFEAFRTAPCLRIVAENWIIDF